MSAPVASTIRSPSSPSLGTKARSLSLPDCRVALSRASNSQVGQPQVGDSAGTVGRRTYPAGECWSRPSISAVR